MIAPALVGLLVFFVYPLLANVYYSFTRYDLLSPPEWIGLRNYAYLFTQDPRVGRAALNTLWLVLIMVPVKILSALVVAGLLVRVRSARGAWRTLFYLPALVPPVASVVIFVFMFNPGIGPVNAVLRMVGVTGPLWFSDPAWSKPSLVVLAVWMMGDLMVIFLAALLNVPRELHEAAALDGANGLQRTMHITLPSISPVLVFAGVTGVIAALQYFTEASVASGIASGQSGANTSLTQVMGYPDDSLLTYTQWLYARGFGDFQLGYAAALAVVLFFATAIAISLLLRRIGAFTQGGGS